MWVEENWLEHEMKSYGSTVKRVIFFCATFLFIFKNLKVHKTQGLSFW
jgi:hypothetical protein